MFLRVGWRTACRYNCPVRAIPRARHAHGPCPQASARSPRILRGVTILRLFFAWCSPLSHLPSPATAPAALTVTSPTLTAGQPIPKQHTADGENTSPGLRLDGRAGHHEVVRAHLRRPRRADAAAVRALGDLQHPGHRQGAAGQHPDRSRRRDAGRDRRRRPGPVGLPPADLSRTRAAARQGAQLPLHGLRARRRGPAAPA